MEQQCLGLDVPVEVPGSPDVESGVVAAEILGCVI